MKFKSTKDQTYQNVSSKNNIWFKKNLVREPLIDFALCTYVIKSRKRNSFGNERKKNTMGNVYKKQ